MRFHCIWSCCINSGTAGWAVCMSLSTAILYAPHTLDRAYYTIPAKLHIIMVIESSGRQKSCMFYAKANAAIDPCLHVIECPVCAHTVHNIYTVIPYRMG